MNYGRFFVCFFKHNVLSDIEHFEKCINMTRERQFSKTRQFVFFLHFYSLGERHMFSAKIVFLYMAALNI